MFSDRTKVYIVTGAFIVAVVTSLTGMHATSGVAMMTCGYFLGSLEATRTDKGETK